MREVFGAFAVFAGLVFVLLIAIRGFRPDSGSSDGRQSSARSTGYLRRYRVRSRVAIALTALPVGWALGEIASPTTSSLVAASVLGLFGGALLNFGQVGAVITPIVGVVGLVVSINRVACLGTWEVWHRVLLIVCTILVVVSTIVVSSLKPSLRVWGLIAVMTGLNLAVFGIGLQGGEFGNPSTGTILILISMCVIGVPVIASIAPTVVLPLFALGLVTTKAMIDLGVLDGRNDASAIFVIVASVGAVGSRWLGAVVRRNP